MEVCLAAILLLSFIMIFRTQHEYAQGASTYKEAAETAKIPELVAIPAEQLETSAESPAEDDVTDPNLSLLSEVNLNELQTQNPDILGWISIPGTVLSYPLIQGEDNDYYLKHTWQRDSSSVGSIFMDYRCDGDLSDFHTIIYGHRMRNGSMFASLKDYLEQDYWSAHPSIYLACAGGVYRYDIFAAYEADVFGHVYDLNFPDEADKEAFITSCLNQSVIETGITPPAGTHLLTLSTCTGRGYRTRWVVQAVQTECMPAEPSDAGEAAPNS